MSESVYDQVQRCAAFLRGKISVQPAIGIILGSGLGTVAQKVEKAVSLPFSDVEGFPRSSVAGHAGRLVCGTLSGKNVAVMAGRGHVYEGNSVATVVFPVRAMRAPRVETLIVTHAPGGLHGNFPAGTFLAIKDHIHLF